jgi:hypothetical protein
MAPANSSRRGRRRRALTLSLTLGSATSRSASVAVCTAAARTNGRPSHTESSNPPAASATTVAVPRATA